MIFYIGGREKNPFCKQKFCKQTDCLQEACLQKDVSRCFVSNFFACSFTAYKDLRIRRQLPALSQLYGSYDPWPVIPLKKNWIYIE